MRHLFKIELMMLGLAVVATAIASGCANAPLNTEMSRSEIRTAENSGALEVPRSSLHLQLAKKELDLAKWLSKRGMKEKTASMLLRAEADADIAVALSKGDNEKSEAQATLDRVHYLRQMNP